MILRLLKNLRNFFSKYKLTKNNNLNRPYNGDIMEFIANTGRDPKEFWILGFRLKKVLGDKLFEFVCENKRSIWVLLDASECRNFKLFDF